MIALSALLLASGLLFARPATDLMNGLQQHAEVDTQRVNDDPRRWLELASTWSDGRLHVLVGVDELSDETLGWLDRAFSRLDLTGPILLIGTDATYARIRRLAPSLADRLIQVPMDHELAAPLRPDFSAPTAAAGADAPDDSEIRFRRAVQYLDEKVWPLIPPGELGRPMSKDEEERLLGIDEIGT